MDKESVALIAAIEEVAYLFDEEFTANDLDEIKEYIAAANKQAELDAEH